MANEAREFTLAAAQSRALDSVGWAQFHFGAALTSRQTPRRVVLSLCALGLVKSVGMVEQCDDDGSLLCGRAEREGFALTGEGLRVSNELGHYFAAMIIVDRRRKAEACHVEQ